MQTTLKGPLDTAAYSPYPQLQHRRLYPEEDSQLQNVPLMKPSAGMCVHPKKKFTKKHSRKLKQRKSLTLDLASLSAPRSRRARTTSFRPSDAAPSRGVNPSCRDMSEFKAIR